MSLQRLSRAEAVLGKENIELLSGSTVLIAGIGGVGGHTLDALARSGVCNFILVDSDKFEESNLNRQILCTENEIGEYKVDSALKYLKSIDSGIKAEIYNQFIDQTNIKTFMDKNPTVVVDAIDTIESKVMLIEECLKTNTKIVSSMGAALRQDPTQIKTGDISQTSGDPLAKILRNKLRKNGITTGFKCVYSTEKPIKISNGILGSIETVTGCFGLTLAKLAIDAIIESNKFLS